MGVFVRSRLHLGETEGRIQSGNRRTRAAFLPLIFSQSPSRRNRRNRIVIMASWQYRNDDFKFVDFGAKETAVLEKAWCSGSKSATVTIHSHKYIMDLESFTQKNASTGKERIIRRRGAEGEAWTRAPVWEWESGKGVFTPYDQATSDSIERAYMKDQLCLHVALPTSAHKTLPFTVHFGHMHQKNDDTDAVRRIRRVVKHIEPAASKTPGELGDAKVDPISKTSSATSSKAKTPTKREREESADEEAAAAAPPKPLAAQYPVGSASKLQAAAHVSLKDWGQDQSVLHLTHVTEQDTSRGANEEIKVAGFDMDDTLVYPKSGAVFPKSRGDWQWLHPSVPAKLKALRDEGFQIVIFTNQSGIGNKGWDEDKATNIKGKIIDLGFAAGVPLSAFVSAKEDDLRKPGPGLWHMFLKHGTGGRKVNMKDSFYVGDAAGRQMATMAGRKKDFSCSDRKFAYNVGLRFQTPEEFFLGSLPEKSFGWDGLGPDDLAKLPTAYDPKLLASFTSSSQEMVLFVGFPGSGKSTFYERFMKAKGYFHINRDALKTPEKCLAAAETYLSQKKSCVVDNTNPSPDDRAKYIKLAQKHKVPVRAFVFLSDAKIANHMNIVRARLGIVPRISSMVYNIYKSKFVTPATKEGLAEVVEIPMVADFAGLPKEAREYFYELS
jgi:bifunctional polynucleotide phosphatase/kinase